MNLCKSVVVAAILLPTLFIACDDAPAAECVNFRGGGDPETLYLSQYDANITVDVFAKMVIACPDKAHLAVTFTRYPPSAAVDSQVIGLGFSVSATAAWAQCYEDMMVSMGAKPLP